MFAVKNSLICGAEADRMVPSGQILPRVRLVPVVFQFIAARLQSRSHKYQEKETMLTVSLQHSNKNVKEIFYNNFIYLNCFVFVSMSCYKTLTAPLTSVWT